MSNEDQSKQEQPQNTRLFNPNEHLMKIGRGNDAKDYLAVQWRLVWFRSLCPDGVIETEMVHLDLDRETQEEVYVWNNETRRSEKTIKRAPGFAVFRATVKDGKGGMATGTKSEKAASFPDYIEKAETGAIGRALAALGYGTQFAGDEFDEQHRLADAPVDRGEEKTPITPTSKTTQPTGQQQASTSTKNTTDSAQSIAIADMSRKAYNRAKALGINTKETWDAFVLGTLKTQKPMGQWTLNDVSAINGELTRRENEKQPAEAKS